jgi:hypothetical protein
MAASELTTGTTTPEAGRPRPTRAVRAELTESPEGWALTVHCDGATADALRRAGVDGAAFRRLSVAISPNLVPGTPFDVDTVVIAVDQPSAG